jgi:Carboxypeptidase regulatory-like domain
MVFKGMGMSAHGFASMAYAAFVVASSAFAVFAASAASSAITAEITPWVFLSAPTSEIRQDTTVTLAVAPRTSADTLKPGCGIYVGTSASGAKKAGHPYRLPRVTEIEGPGKIRMLSFRPSQPDTSVPGNPPQLSLGVHYLVVACPDTGTKVTPELPLRVVATQAPTILTPLSNETNTRPEISWSPVPGVPAYHLLLSDQALTIDPQGGSVSGASIIWQAIVSGTRITYGTPDPSGNFSQVPAPPLSQGVQYNLVVLNNYDGRSALATSSRAQGLRLFTLNLSGTPPGKPRIVAPTKGANFTAPADSQLTFRWTASRGGDPANVYRLFVYAAENQQGSTVLMPVWQGEFTDTTARLDASRTLLTQKYIAKVFAVSASGLTAVSDTVSFNYKNQVQTLSVAARGPNGAGDTVQLNDVRVTVTPITGGGQPFPLFTVSDQRVEKILAVGTYTLDFTKEGYMSDRRSVTLGSSGTLQVTGFLPQAPCILQMRAVGEDGQPLDNTLAHLETETGIKVEARSDAAGRFVVGLQPGRYRLNLTRVDYAPRSDTTIDFSAGETKNLGNLALKKATGVLSGTVSTSAGPLPGAEVSIRNEAGALLRSLLSDGSGRFQTLLVPGTYKVSATSAGMVGAEQTVSLKQSADLNFLLQGGASILRGRVRLILPNGTASASPVQGVAVVLTHDETGVERKTLSDVNGEYSFSVADAGAYTLIAYLDAPGSEPVQSNEVSVTFGSSRVTLVRDLAVRALPDLQGDLRLQPDTAIDINTLTVNLIDNIRDAVVRQTRVFRDSAGLHFRFESIADGEYRLSAQGGAYATENEPIVDITDGVLPTAKITLTLTKFSGTLIFSLRAGDSAVTGTLRLLSPRSVDLKSGDTLKPASFGTYQIAASALDTARLPLLRQAQVVQKDGTAPVTVIVQCPFAHRILPEKQKDGRYLFSLHQDFGLDSGYLVIETQNGLRQTTSLRLKSGEVTETGGIRDALIRLPAGATRLQYWYVVYYDDGVYSNEEPSRRFTLPLFKPGELAEIRIDVGDSVPLPARTQSTLTLSAFDASGQSLDSALAARGNIKWRLIGRQAISLRAPKGNRLTLATGAPPEEAVREPLEKSTPLEKRAAIPMGKASAANFDDAFADFDWDTLAITASLDGLERGALVAVRVADAAIHFIRVATSLGEAAQIESPRAMSLRLMAFDTTYSPPLPLLPNPSFTIEPSEAGVLRGSELTLDSQFIGPLRIIGRHTFADGIVLQTELFPSEDPLARGINVGQTITTKTRGKTYRNGQALSLITPDSLIGGDAATILRVYRRRLPKTFTSLRDSAVVGDVWEVSNPSGVSLRGRLTLGLTVPHSLRKRGNAMRRFDAIDLNWLPYDTLATEFDGALRPQVRAEVKGFDGNYWAILSAAEATEAMDMRIVPNPFSPRVTALRDGNDKPGTRIRFRPDSPESPEVTVTLAVYTLEGERVRILADHQTHPKEFIEYYWDGKTDQGRTVRNGRYLLSLTLKPTGGGVAQRILRPVVVYE